MAISKNTTKEKLLAEVNKLQRKIALLEKKSIAPKETSTRWHSLFKHSTNTVIVVDNKHTIIDVNKVSGGLSKSKTLGKKIETLCDKTSESIIKKALTAVFKTGKSQEYTVFKTVSKVKSTLSCNAIPLIENKKVVAVAVELKDITKDIVSQNKFIQSEENLSQILNNINELVYYIEFLPEGKKQVKFLGPQIKTILDVTAKEFLGDAKKVVTLCHPDDLEKIREAAQELRKKKKPQKFVYRFYHRSKKAYLWIEERITPQLDKAGNYIGNFGIVRDVTEHVSSELLLRESEEKFRMLAENALDVVYRFSMSPKAKYEYVSPSIYNMSGYYPEEFYADPNLGFKIIHPEDKILLGDSQKIIQAQTPISYVKEPNLILRWVKKDGSVIWTETVNIPIKNKEGKIVALEGISRDITEQKESEERFKILSNVTFEGIVFSDNGIIVDANDQFLSMYGYSSRKEIIGKDVVNDFVVEEEQKVARKFIRMAKSEPLEVRTKKKDGSIITVETKGQNIPYLGKNIRATVIYNITERKQYEHNLRESERTLSTLMGYLPGMAYRCSFDEQRTMLFVSKGCLELTGYRANDLAQNNKIAYGELILPDHKQRISGQIKSAIEKKKPYVLSYKIKTAKGEIRWVWEKGEGVFSEKGKLLFIEGFIADYTDRHEYEKELKRSRENYKSLVDYSPDGVIIHVGGSMKFANPSALKMIGVDSFEELENKSALEFIMPEYQQQILDRMVDAANGKQLDFIEIKVKNKRGEIFEVETKSTLTTFNGGEAIQVVFHDISSKKQLLKEQARAQIAEETNELLEQEITKRKVIQLQLQESQKYTRLIINGSIDMICASDNNGYITEFNAAAQKTFGYTAAEVIGKHVSMLYWDPQQRNKITEEELYKKGAYAGEVWNIRKNGERFIAFLSASILRNEAGEMIGAMGVSRDISELKSAEERLYAQSAKLNAVFESSSHIIWTVDKDVKLTSYNKNFAAFLKKHYRVDAFEGISMISGDTVSSSEYNNFWIKKYEAAFSGEPQHFETKLTNFEGEIVWREVFLNPIYDEAKKIVEVSGIGHDVTEKKFAEEKIRQSLKEKEVLLKEVHHRVKNNLQVISSILNLQSSYVKDVSTLNILKESQNRIKSMAFIHESLYQTKDFSSINFSEYVVNLSQNLIQSYSNFDNEIKLNLDIQNVFLNLDLAIPCGLIINEIISNALKYAFVDKKEDCEITIRMILDNESLVLFIGDNGRGLPKEIDYRNTQSLGLQLVVTLTDQLNGTIEMDSSNGTKYTIVFKQNQVKNRI